MPLQANIYCCDCRPLDRSLVDAAPCLSGASAETPAKTRILFVDDEAPMIRVLKMGMRSMSAQWEMEFVDSGEAALALLEQQAFDVIVTDMRMPGMNGAQLLNHVLRLHPKTIRIVLSGYSDLSEVVNCVGLTHQFLEKPCSLDDLKNCLKRVTEVKTRLHHKKLCEVTASLKNLPSLPELYLEIADALQSPTASAQRIAEIATRDPALCAKLLQLSNSAFFGFSHKVFSVDEAVQLLGVSVIQTLALATPLFSSFDHKKFPAFPLEQIWHHSARTGALGRQIFRQHLNDTHLAEQAFAAGVLHDLGKIILADGMPAEYAAVFEESRATRVPLAQVERQHFQTTHAEVGAYLLALWGLPMPLVEAVACHHQPRRCGLNDLCLAGVVHIANALEHVQVIRPEIVSSPVDLDYLKYIQLDRQYETWRAEIAVKNT